MKEIKKLMIVDADVARSAGLTENPASSRSRQLLDEMAFSPGFKAVFCSSLLAEWKKHASSYSVKWRGTMFAKGRFVISRHVENYEEKIDGLDIEEKIKEAAKKDSHLISSAVFNDASIASRDNRAKEAFAVVSESVGEIREVVWFNPVESPDFIGEYVNGTSHLPNKYKVGNC